ncbi:hypothetical protein Lal_00003446 [Lupinus albus]|nr:hypothetical protein Lal_00003446 [Lupinus albus]
MWSYLYYVCTCCPSTKLHLLSYTPFKKSKEISYGVDVNGDGECYMRKKLYGVGFLSHSTGDVG